MKQKTDSILHYFSNLNKIKCNKNYTKEENLIFSFQKLTLFFLCKNTYLNEVSSVKMLSILIALNIHIFDIFSIHSSAIRKINVLNIYPLNLHESPELSYFYFLKK